MAHELEVFTSYDSFSGAVDEIATGARTEPILARWGAGLLGFAGAVFPEIATNDIFAQRNTREAEGRGPHFDVYNTFVDEAHPWLGHFNLSGSARIQAVPLPDDLAKSYFDRYPTQTDAAFDARRHFSRIALEAPDVDIATGLIKPMTGFVLPVRAAGPHIVHDIIPITDEPGSYIKLIVPVKEESIREDLSTKGYEPLDIFCTRALGATITKEPVIEAVLPPAAQPVRRAPAPVHRRRSCNLD